MRAAHGHPVLLAETFVDPSRFSGTCCRASNWMSLGRTRGHSRKPGGSARWRENGRPKEVFVYEMETGAAAGAFLSPSRGRRTAPAASTFHCILSSLPPDAPLDRALGAWTRQRSDGRRRWRWTARTRAAPRSRSTAGGA